MLLVTHGHFDHFDAETLALARRLHPTMPCIHELSLYLGAQLGDAAEVIGMNAGGTVETHGLRVTMVPAVHSSGDVMGGDRVHYFGESIGFVIELENGFRIYDSGDTTAFGDMALIRELYKPDLAILPIGGHFTMDPAGAAVAVGLLGVRDVIPVHWGTFPILGRARRPRSSPSSGRAASRRTSSTGSRASRRTSRRGLRWAGRWVRPDDAGQPAVANGSAVAPSRACFERPDGSRTRRPASHSWLTPGCMLCTITRSVSIEAGSATDTMATPSCSCTAGMSASV